MVQLSVLYILCICSTVSNWVYEMDRWGPTIIKIAYKGSPQYRKALQPMIRSRKFNVLLTTYEYVIKDKALLSKVSLQWRIWSTTTNKSAFLAVGIVKQRHGVLAPRFAGSTWSLMKDIGWRTTTVSWPRSWTPSIRHHIDCYWREHHYRCLSCYFPYTVSKRFT